MGGETRTASRQMSTAAADGPAGSSAPAGRAAPEKMPARMAPVFATLCGVNADTPINQVTREQRQAIGRALKALPLRVVGTRPIEEAIVTRGGVDVLEITPGTMMSKNVPGLFFAGEVLDVDGYTGGFNLQIAFSTGYLAGNSIWG